MTKHCILFCVLMFSAAAFAAPLNDSFANRLVVAGAQVVVTGSTVDGTVEEQEPPAFRILSTVWFEWTAPVSGHLRARFLQTSNFMWGHVFAGTNLTNLALAGAFNSLREWNFDVEQGVTYQLRVGPDQPTPSPRLDGPFTFRLEYNAPPSNDHFTNRIRLTNAVERIVFRNVLATLEPEENQLSPDGGNSVWYEWQAPASGVARLLVDNSHATVAGVYTGNNGSISVTNNHLGGGNCWEESGFPATAGQIYYLQLDSCTDGPGNHGLTLSLNGAARLDSPRPLIGGGIELAVFGERYRNYVLQGSTNLMHWHPISTNMYYNSPLTFEVPGGDDHRFYRVGSQ